MDDAQKPPVKRSRFDQTEEPKRNSRFDRRSRSPQAARQSEGRRSRSPARDSNSPAPKGGLDPAVAAGESIDSIATCCDATLSWDNGDIRRVLTFKIAAAAARINAQLQAKKAIQPVDTPPMRATESPAPPAPPKLTPKSPTGAGNSASNINGEMYIADGDYIRDIEVNDLRNRYTLTKGSTQKMVNIPYIVLSTDICKTCLASSHSIVESFPCSRLYITFVGNNKLTLSLIASHKNPVLHLLTSAA